MQGYRSAKGTRQHGILRRMFWLRAWSGHILGGLHREPSGPPEPYHTAANVEGSYHRGGAQTHGLGIINGTVCGISSLAAAPFGPALAAARDCCLGVAFAAFLLFLCSFMAQATITIHTPTQEVGTRPSCFA